MRLRPATLADLDLLRRWDEQPHVVDADPNDDWEWEHELARTPDWREQLVAEADDGRPIGFVQIIDPAREETHYWGDCAPDLRAIDIWIGDEADLGRGYGTEMMRLALARCFADRAVEAVIIDPLASNTRARRFYERLGFRFVENRRFNDDDCAVYRLERDRWRTAQSKFLSFVLRHDPGAIGLTVDAHGWAVIDELVARASAHGRPLTRALVEELVATSPKQRFAISDDGARIRASQGHSIEVDLAYEPVEPPETLFHGTVAAALDAIRAEGLRRMDRHHVHLSPDVETARAVGIRRGRPVVLRVAAARMHRDGHVFYRSANGVWLTERVPPGYLDVVDA